MDLFSQKDPPASVNHAREQRFPVTLGAKVRQFSYRHYWRHNPVFRNVTYAWIVTTYLCFKLQGVVKQPAVWDEWMAKRTKDYDDCRAHAGGVQHDADHKFAHENLQHLARPSDGKKH